MLKGHLKYLKYFNSEAFFRSSAIVGISSAIVGISSELVEISSELVEISSELVEISSELVLRIAELLIISVFRKTSQSVPHPLISPCNEAKGDPVYFHLYLPVC